MTGVPQHPVGGVPPEVVEQAAWIIHPTMWDGKSYTTCANPNQWERIDDARDLARRKAADIARLYAAHIKPTD